MSEIIAYHPNGDTSTKPVAYTLINDDETPEQALIRAKTSKPELASLFFACTWGEYEQAVERVMLGQPLTEITEERYNEMLEVLPPRCWERGFGFQRFYMSEFIMLSYTEQYASYQGRYFCRTIDACRRDTWITREEVQLFMQQQEGQP